MQWTGEEESRQTMSFPPPPLLSRMMDRSEGGLSPSDRLSDGLLLLLSINDTSTHTVINLPLLPQV